MKLRSIPPHTYLSLARERHNRLTTENREIISQPKTLRREFTLLEAKSVRKPHQRQRLSRKPFEGKLAKWQEELDELSQWADEGLDVSKIKKSIEERIKGLLDLLEGK